MLWMRACLKRVCERLTLVVTVGLNQRYAARRLSCAPEAVWVLSALWELLS
jgi:hypothetical protein